MSGIYVKVKPSSTNPPSANSLGRNRIVVTSSYVKGYGVVLSACPGEIRSSGIVMIEVTSCERIGVEGLARNNKKKVEAWEKIADEQIKERAGAAWDLVAMLLRRFSLEIDES